MARTEAEDMTSATRGGAATWRKGLAAALFAACVAACAATETAPGPVPAAPPREPPTAAAKPPEAAPAPPPGAPEASAPAPETADPFEAKNCIEGLPRLTNEHEGGVRVVRRRGYVLVHASREKVPLVVCEGIPRQQLDGPAERKNNFKPDPELPAGERAELADYAGSGFDRGHQAPAEDMSQDQELMDESFFLSNMCPQVGVGFNQHIWADLEAWARDRIRQHGGGWIITGPLFLDGEAKTIGPDKVAVPSHFFKVVVVKGDDGRLMAIAFVLENRKYTSDDRKHLERFIESVDRVEDEAGIDLLPRLSPPDEERIERKPSAMWN
jgi:endonuclease G, mitochondrial